MTPFSLPRDHYLMLKNALGSFVRTDLLIKQKQFKPAVVQTFERLLDGMSLTYDEDDSTIEVAGLIVHPLYHEEVYHIGHVVLFTNKHTEVVVGYKNAGFRTKESVTTPQMKCTWQDDNLIVMEDRRRGVVSMLTPSEVHREDWN